MKVPLRLQQAVEIGSMCIALLFETVLLGGALMIAGILATGIFLVRLTFQMIPRPPLREEIKEMFAVALGPFAQDIALRVLEQEREAGKASVGDAGERQLADAGHPMPNWGQKNKPEAKAAHVDANGGLQLVGADAHHDAAR